jgi:hypothetical protein
VNLFGKSKYKIKNKKGEIENTLSHIGEDGIIFVLIQQLLKENKKL